VYVKSNLEPSELVYVLFVCTATVSVLATILIGNHMTSDISHHKN